MSTVTRFNIDSIRFLIFPKAGALGIYVYVCHVARRVSRCWRYITVVRALPGDGARLYQFRAGARARIHRASRFVVKTTLTPLQIAIAGAN